MKPGGWYWQYDEVTFHAASLDPLRFHCSFPA